MMLLFPSQASASTQNSPAHYLWREYTNPVVQNLCFYLLVQIHVDIAIPSTGKFKYSKYTSTLLVKGYTDLVAQNLSFYWHIMNMHLHLLVSSDPWILLFQAQASASTQNTPAHYMWRDTQIQLSKISASFGTNKHTGQHFTPVVLQFPAQASASFKAIQHINCEGIHKTSSSKSLLLMVKIINIWVMWILLFPGKTNASTQNTSTLLVKGIHNSSCSKSLLLSIGTN